MVWLDGLLRTRGSSIFRSKGILNFAGDGRRYVFQGVHMLLDGRPGRAWKPEEQRRSELADRYVLDGHEQTLERQTAVFTKLAATAERLSAAGVEVHLDASGDGLAAGAGTLIKSPGVPQDAPSVQAARARGIPVLGELELAWRLLHNEFVAVTGTNGKTTTTEWIGHIHREAGLPVAAAGNVGTAASSLIGQIDPGATIVCEASSFQLEDAEAFSPEAAVLLNLEPDHLDRHGSFEAYVAAKLRIFANQGNDDVAIAPQGPNELKVVALATGAIRTWTVPTLPFHLTWGDGGREVGFSGSGGLYVLNVSGAGGAPHLVLPRTVKSDDVGDAILSPNGTIIAAVEYDYQGNVKLNQHSIVSGIVEISATTGKPKAAKRAASPLALSASAATWPRTRSMMCACSGRPARATAASPAPPPATRSARSRAGWPAARRHRSVPTPPTVAPAD